MSAESSSPRPDHFKNAVIILLTLVGVFVALITFLQGYASLRSADLVQQSQFRAVNATGLTFRAGLQAAQGIDVQQRYADYVQRAVRADTKARALRLGGGQTQIDLAAEYALDAERWNLAAAEVAQSDPLLAEYGQDAALYGEALAREAYMENERQHVLLEQSRAWSRKANDLVAILSTLAVALFLAGLSLTISSRMRYVLAAAGVVLAAICVFWLAAVMLSPVPNIPEAALQHFVEGKIKYNVSQARGEDAVEAVADFDAAIDLAPQYGRAYFYRSLANTDARLADIRLDLGKAVADGERALALGNQSSPVYGNLGWLYYLNGQYHSALAMTEQALALSPDDCYLPFNRGLILSALGRQSEAERTYSELAIPCALNQGDFLRNYYLDVGVIDLQDLALARPDLAPDLEASIFRLKEAQASLAMFGETEPHPMAADFEPLYFGDALDSQDNVIGIADEYPQTTTVVYAQLKFSGMTPDTHWMSRWLLNGRETAVGVYDTWDYGDSGTTWVRITNATGLNSGDYELDLFVEGRLVTAGRFTVRPGPLPPMTSYQSTDVGVIIHYPIGWNVTDLADNEVSVAAARDPQRPTFFGVTAWLVTTGSDDDVLNLFEGYFGALRQAFRDVTTEPAESFTVAGHAGWLRYYTYTDAQGTPIQGAVAGTLYAPKQYAYVLAIESHADEWDAHLDLFNVMLSRVSIDE
jgi:tetratricopeptide (TPR) repeat protein